MGTFPEAFRTNNYSFWVDFFRMLHEKLAFDNTNFYLIKRQKQTGKSNKISFFLEGVFDSDVNKFDVNHIIFY